MTLKVFFKIPAKCFQCLLDMIFNGLDINIHFEGYFFQSFTLNVQFNKCFFAGRSDHIDGSHQFLVKFFSFNGYFCGI